MPVEEPLLNPEGSQSSRIPRPSPTGAKRAALSFREAYERVTEEEAQEAIATNQRAGNTEVDGSPSPAPRPRPSAESQREIDGANNFREPSIRIPRTWGRRAKSNPSWLTRAMTRPFDSSDEAHSLPPQVVSEGSIDWAGAAEDVPLQSIEDGPPIQEPTPPHSRPNSAQPQNSSPQRSLIWDPELDFDARSLLISSSLNINVRNTKLNEIAAREIEALSKRAVATSRLEEIKERNSKEQSASPEAVRSVAKEGLSTEVLPDKEEPEAPIAPLGQRRSPSQRRKALLENRAAAEAAYSKALPRRKSLREAAIAMGERRPSSPEISDESEKEAVVKKPSDRVSFLQDYCPEKHEVLDESEKEAVVKKPSDSASPLQDYCPEKPEDVGSTAKEPAANDPSESISFLQDYCHDRTILEEEGEHIAGTPVTIFKGAGVNDKKPFQVGDRDESWDTLRKLSQIASATPSPAPVRLTGRSSEESLKHLSGQSADIKRLSGASTPPKSDVDPEERIAAEASLFELPDIKSERNSTHIPTPPGEGNVDETPRPNVDPLSMPTPIVTGAYIDTPVVRGRQPKTAEPASPPIATYDALHEEVSRLAIKDFIRNSSAHSNMHRKDSRPGRRGKEQGASRLSTSSTADSPEPKPRQRSRAPLINTANIASVEEDLRRIHQEAEIEDSTLDDFDELLAAEIEDADPNSTTIIDSPPDLEREGKGQPMSDQERERRKEMLTIERMNKTIRSGLLNIRDAKRGIERLEDQVSSSPEPISHKYDHDHKKQNCPICTPQSSFYHITLPVPRLWSRDPTKWTGVRFTWLGLLLAVFMAWLFAETVTCEYICHPEYASTNDWSPDDPFWGGALPKLLDRVTGGIMNFMLKYVWWAVLYFWSSWSIASGRAGAGKAPVEWPEATSMLEDELL